MNFYFEAVGVLDKLDAKKGSIKGVLASVPEKNRKRTAALVIETLKYKQVLSEVIDAAQLLKQEKKVNSRNLALVLVHDLLLAGGIQAGDGPIKQAVLRHKTRLNSEFQRSKIKRGAKANAELAQTDDCRAATIPRYIRVNRTCWTIEEALKTFQEQGYELGDPLSSSSKNFQQDAHIPDLLAFHPSTRFVDDPLYLSGKLILQDKASCFPAHVLAPPAREDAVVIDATAAPGNKTSHLCAIMQNKGTLYAFERDRKRYGTLKTMLSRAHCSNVEAVNADFLTTSPDDPKYGRATHILLDPSCSGSGIVNRMDHLLDNEVENDGDSERLNKLATFQLKMIEHAMTFPNVQRIVYSTCSVHAIENEHVVRAALKTEAATKNGFVLASRRDVLPTWNRRGIPVEMDSPADADSVVRCSPGEDATNGFFVSLFVRRDVDENTAPLEEARKRKAREEGPDSSEPQANKRKKKKRKTKKDTVA